MARECLRRRREIAPHAQLEQAFYDSVLRDPLLQPLFGEGRASHVDHPLQEVTRWTWPGDDAPA